MTELTDANAGLTSWPEDLSHQYQRDGIWQNENLACWLQAKLDKYANDTLLIGPNTEGEHWQQLTGAHISAITRTTATRLQQLGLRQGDKVVMQMANNNNFILSLFALLQLGVVPVMALPGHGPREIRQFIQLTAAKAWFVSAESTSFNVNALGQELLDSISTFKYVIIDSQFDVPHQSLCSLIATQDETGDSEFVAPRLPGHTVDPASMALLLCSGGTTGIPKLIPRTHRDYIYNAKQSAYVSKLSADDCYMVALPAAHNFPLACPGILGALDVGAKTIFCPIPSPEIAFEYMQRAQVTVTALVPTLVNSWLEYARLNTAPAESLRLLQVGGAKLDERVARKIGKQLGCQLQQVFGMAEGLLNFTREQDPDVLKLKTQGRPMCDSDELRIVDENGQDVANGQCGELLTRGPYTIRGYYKDPQANQKSFTQDGYYCTGDRVRRLSTGHLIVEGRIKEVIRRGGETVSVETLESLLAMHPDVQDVAVVGLPCQQLGEQTCAALVLTPTYEQQPNLADIRQYLSAEGVARHTLPDCLAFITDIPLTAVGKIARQKLSAQIQQHNSQQQGIATI